MVETKETVDMTCVQDDDGFDDDGGDEDDQDNHDDSDEENDDDDEDYDSSDAATTQAKGQRGRSGAPETLYIQMEYCPGDTLRTVRPTSPLFECHMWLSSPRTNRCC